MKTVDELIAVVKKEADFKDRLASKADDQWKRGNHLALAADLRQVADLLASYRDKEAFAPENVAVSLGTADDMPRPDEVTDFASLDDLSDLPPELLQEMNLPEGELQERQIVAIIQGAGRPLATNEIMVAFYRKHKEVLQRRPLASRLYRMTTKNMIEGVPGKKGLYRTPEKGA